MNEAEGFHWAWWIFFTVGFMSLPWNIGLCIDGYRWFKKKYRARKRKRVYKNMNFIRWQYKESNGTAMVDKRLFTRPKSMRDERYARPLRKIDV